MANRKRAIPQYGTVTLNGLDYYRTRVQDADGKLVALYARTPEELYDKELNALEQIDNDTFCRKSPTVAEYCEKWLLMQSVHVRATTMTDYTSKVKRHIIKELGDMRMADVTLDDIQLALVPVSKKSASVYKSVVVLYKSIFRAAKESRIIENNPTVYLTSKGGGIPQKEKEALTDEQAARLLDAIQGLPPYVFVMLGLYAGLRREEILALQWDSVYLDTDTPYLTVRRAWHTESNRPVILDELKTKAAERNIPLPICLADCLREAKANSTSEYVVPNRDGDPLSYTQFKRLWQYIVTRTTKERVYYQSVPQYGTGTEEICGEIFDQIPVPADQEAMREAIRRERRVELCCESGLRYFDLRRWKMAEEVLNQPTYGMNFAGTVKSDDASDPNAFFVRKVEMANRHYEKKYYWFPIFQTEIDKDPTLVQSPFWDE